MHLLPLALLAGAVAAATAADGADRWRPADHPATIARTVTGYTRPRRTLELAAEDGGRVVAIRARGGERLTNRADERPLIELDPTLVGLAVAMAADAVASAEADAQRLVAMAETAERDRALADKEQDRIAKLAPGQVAGVERDRTANARDNARLALDRIAAEQAKVAAGLSEARHRLAHESERLARCRLAAPPIDQEELTALAARFAPGTTGLVDWVVVERLVEPGALVQAGQAIVRLADVGVLQVDLRLDEPEVAAIDALAARDGRLPVRFGRSGRTAPAVLARRDPGFDPVSRKRLFELWIAGADAPEASGGLAIEVALEIADPAGALQVPARFLSARFERSLVTLDDGREVPVQVLRRQGDIACVVGDQLGRDAVLRPAAGTGD